MSYGIPMLYYGTESKFRGGQDPLNREVYDPSQGNIDQTMKKYIKILNEVRREHHTYDLEPEFKES